LNERLLNIYKFTKGLHNAFMITRDEINKLKEMPVVFVLGNGRSGTTLLQALLDAHPHIVAPSETKFIEILYPRFSSIKNWQEKDIMEFVSGLKKDPQFVDYWNINWEQLVKDLMLVKEDADYSLICKTVYYEMKGNRDDIRLISDKNPLYVLFIDKLSRLFPGAKFIHIVRDPRAVINSSIQTFYMKNFIFNSYGWLINNSIIEKSKKENPSRYFTIYYEKLVENPELTLTQLCGFLNLPFSSEMLTPKVPDMSHKPEVQKKFLGRIHKNISMPVNTGNVDKWETELDPNHRGIVELITGAYAKKMYEYNVDLNRKEIKHVPYLLLVRKKLEFIIWVWFTRVRFSNLSFNLWYAKKFKKGRIGEAY
jgi:protein-tyrosine sulfotransferase